MNKFNLVISKKIPEDFPDCIEKNSLFLYINNNEVWFAAENADGSIHQDKLFKNSLLEHKNKIGEITNLVGDSSDKLTIQHQYLINQYTSTCGFPINPIVFEFTSLKKNTTTHHLHWVLAEDELRNLCYLAIPLYNQEIIRKRENSPCQQQALRAQAHSVNTVFNKTLHQGGPISIPRYVELDYQPITDVVQLTLDSLKLHKLSPERIILDDVDILGRVKFYSDSKKRNNKPTDKTNKVKSGSVPPQLMSLMPQVPTQFSSGEKEELTVRNSIPMPVAPEPVVQQNMNNGSSSSSSSSSSIPASSVPLHLRLMEMQQQINFLQERIQQLENEKQNYQASETMLSRFVIKQENRLGQLEAAVNQLKRPFSDFQNANNYPISKENGSFLMSNHRFFGGSPENQRLEGDRDKRQKLDFGSVLK